MGDVVNLRRARKARARDAAGAAAAENRSRSGTPKAARDAERARADLEARRLDGHALTPRGDDA